MKREISSFLSTCRVAVLTHFHNQFDFFMKFNFEK